MEISGSPPARRIRLDEGSHSNFQMNLGNGNLSIRISDSFARTFGGIIRPIAIAGASVLVLRQLHLMALSGVLTEVAESFGLFFRAIKPGSIVVEFAETTPLSEESFKLFLQTLETRLQQLMPSGNFWIERINDPANAGAPLEPLVSELDLAQHILKTICNELEDKAKVLSSGAVDWLDIRNTIGDINCLIKEFEEKRTKISMLSQNGKGKSFILNLLLCLTADSEEEYKQNNMCLKDMSKANCRQEMEKIPQVLREDLEKLKEDEREEAFQKMIANCKRTSSSHLKMENATENEKKSFDSLSNYLKTDSLKFLQPYLLPVKGRKAFYLTTTKCNVRLKYGPVYQMKIKYFNIEDLQEILYELVIMIKEGTVDDRGLEKDRRDTSRKALEGLFCLLTTYFSDCSFDQNILQSIEDQGSIQLRQDVKDLAGTSECYMGDGEDVMKDRIFIREKLQEYITMQKIPKKERTLQNMKIAALKTIEVYAPCKVLIGKELLETPGIDESDPLALKEISDVLNEVNSTLYISEYAFKISEGGVKEFLLDSGFLQKCVNNLEDQKLFLVAYPEKNISLRLSLEMADEENLTTNEQSEKRQDDLSELERLFQQTLSDEFKRNVSTPTLQPVFHASVLMQDGNPTEVMREHENFLKLTGIQSFLEEIDHFAFNRAKFSVIEVKELLCQLEDRADQYLQFCDWKRSAVEKMQKIMCNRESMGLLLASATEGHEKVLTNTFKKLEVARDQLISNTVKPLLEEAVEKAMEQWNSNKSLMNRMGIFNPYFNGRHPAYKVKLYDIAFGCLKMPNFTEFLDKTRKIMEEYKEGAIDDLSKFLAENLEKDTDKIQRLVRLAAERELVGAIGWYMGKKRLPFAERKLHKLFEEGCVDSLKQLLKRVYCMKNIEEMKETVSKDLKPTVTNASEYFKTKLELELHVTRWKSFKGKIETRGKNSKPRIWQLLTTALKNELKRNEIEEIKNLKSDFSNMKKMVDVALNGTRTTS